MLQGERRFGALFAAAIAVALLAAPASASAKFCSEKPERHDYAITAAGHNGGTTTLDGKFTSATRVEFSYVYDATLRVCESIGAIRMDRPVPERGRATHSGEYVRDLATGERCSWSTTIDTAVGPLKVSGYDFDRANRSATGWAFVFLQGIGYDKDELLRDAYTQILTSEHVAACGEDVPMVSTLGPDSEVFGALTAFAPDFVWPGVTVEGRGKRNPPPVLRKLLAGKDTKVAGQVDYPNHPAGSFVEHGTWLVSLEFKRRGR